MLPNGCGVSSRRSQVRIGTCTFTLHAVDCVKVEMARLHGMLCMVQQKGNMGGYSTATYRSVIQAVSAVQAVMVRLIQ